MNARSWVLPSVALGAALSLTLAACRSQLSGDPGPNGGPGGKSGAGQTDSGSSGLDAGTCTFTTEVYYPALTTGLTLTAMSSGDLNLDGRPDIVAAGGSSLEVWLGQSDGGLAPAAEYATLGATAAVQVADFNADNLPDISVLDSQPQNASQLFVGDGDAGLSLATRPGPGFPYVTAGVTGDFDQDGYTDWAVSTDNAGVNGDVALLLNPVTGTTFFSESILLDSVEVRAGIATGDFNNDGFADLVVSDPIHQTATVFAGQGDGGFLEQPPVAAGLDPTALAAMDLNGDMLTDVVTTNPDDLSLHFFAQTDGGLAPGVRVASAAGYPQVLAAGSWSGDGLVGVVTGETNPSAVGFYVQDGGTLAAVGSLTPSSDLAAVALVDVDGDGQLDVVGLLDGGVGVYHATCP